MIDQLATNAALALLNRALARESWAQQRLAPFAGRSARLELPPFSVQFSVKSDGLLQTATGEIGEPSVTLGIDPANLPNVLFDPKAALRNVKLSGDAEFAQALGFVLQNLKPEPEEELSRFVGDAAAVRIVGFMRAAFAQTRDASTRLADTAADYFVAENPMLVARSEFDAFAQDVARLRDAVERAAKRIEMLEQQTPERR